MVTLGDMVGVVLGVKKDEKSFKNAEKGVKNLAQSAKKLLAQVGFALSLRKIWQMLKQTEAIKKSIEDVKTQWKAVWEEFDNTTGITQVIARWIKNMSNWLLSLFRKVEPAIKNIMKALGGTENALKSILVIAGSIGALKSLDKVLGLGLSKGKIAVLVTVLYALYLIIEDIIFFIQGKNSMLGGLCKKYGVDVEKLRNKIKGIITKAKSFISNTFGKIKDVLGKVFEKIGKAAEKAFLIIKEFWEKHGKKTAQNLKEAWDKVKDAFDRLKEKLQPFIDKIKEIKDKFSENAESIDIWDKIGSAIEKVSEFIGTVADKIGEIVDSLPTLEEVQGFVEEHKTTLETLATVIGSVAAAIVIVKAAIALYTAVTTVATAVSTGLAAAVAAINWPFIIAVAIIAAVIAIGVLLYKNWDKISAKAKELAGKIKEKFTEIKNSIKEKIEAAKTAVQNVFSKIKSFISEHIVAIIAIITGPIGGLIAYIIKHRDEIKEKISELKEKVAEIMENIKAKIQEKIDAVKEKWEEIKGKVEEVFSGVKAAYETYIQPIFDWINEKIDGIKDKFANSAIGQWISEKFGIDLSGAEEDVEEGTTNIENTMNDTADGAYDSGLDYSQNLASGIRAGLPEVQAASSEVANAMSEQTHFSVPDKGPLKDQDKWGGDFIANLVNGIRNSVPALREAIGSVTSALGINTDLSKTTNLMAGSSSQNVINMNNNWTNNFYGDQSAAFAKSINAQENQAGQSLGNQLAYLR